jgi:hypothetical protein
MKPRGVGGKAYAMAQQHRAIAEKCESAEKKPRPDRLGLQEPKKVSAYKLSLQNFSSRLLKNNFGGH